MKNKSKPLTELIRRMYVRHWDSIKNWGDFREIIAINVQKRNKLSND